jgi:tRNA1(Val) A37 N6-methylase TrmN6
LDTDPDTTTDALLDGRLTLRQPRKGYRAGLDAALLAAAVEAHAGERVLEAGCGPGAALLQAATRSPGARFTGVERDASALSTARGNIDANTLADRVEALAGDVDAGFRTLGVCAFDATFSNPPFFDDPKALRAPHPSRRGAWMADGGLASWTRFLLKAVREGGRITVIHRADRLADLLALLGDTAGSFQVRPVHPFADAPAKRVLVRAIKTGRAPLLLLPPLVLHDRLTGAWRPEIDAVLRGASLDWIT